MSTPDDEKDQKREKQQGSGRPATKFMERPKPEGEPNDEQYWGQGRQQKERNAPQEGKQDPSEN